MTITELVERTLALCDRVEKGERGEEVVGEAEEIVGELDEILGGGVECQ